MLKSILAAAVISAAFATFANANEVRRLPVGRDSVQVAVRADADRPAEYRLAGSGESIKVVRVGVARNAPLPTRIAR